MKSTFNSLVQRSRHSGLLPICLPKCFEKCESVEQQGFSQYNIQLYGHMKSPDFNQKEYYRSNFLLFSSLEEMEEINDVEKRKEPTVEMGNL